VSGASAGSWNLLGGVVGVDDVVPFRDSWYWYSRQLVPVFRISGTGCGVSRQSRWRFCNYLLHLRQTHHLRRLRLAPTPGPYPQQHRLTKLTPGSGQATKQAANRAET